MTDMASPSSQFTRNAATDGGIQVFGGGRDTAIHINGSERKSQWHLEMECLHSLSFQEIDSRKSDITLAHRNTCDWILDTPEFASWLSAEDVTSPANADSTNGILWIKGKPGAGKSTIMKRIFSQYKKQHHDHITVSYFFHARGSSLEKSPLGMYRSLIFQLCVQKRACFERFLVRYTEKTNKHQIMEVRWQAGELQEFLISEMEQQHSKPILLFVDALDECREASVRDVVSFFADLSNEAVTNGISLRICLSSRHYPHISMQCTELVIDDREEHSKDISIYVNDRLFTEDRILRQILLEKADGIFMWAVLVTKILNQLYDEGNFEAMTRKLKEIPPDLDNLFWDILGNDNHNMGETVLMLQWVLFTQKLLSPKELYYAVKGGTTPHEHRDKAVMDENALSRYIKNVSRGLVEIRQEGTETVQFIHESVTDFLLRRNRLQMLDSELSPDVSGGSHNRLASICWSTIVSIASEIIPFKGFGSAKEESKDKHPFLRYASLHLLDHMELAQVCGACQTKNIQAVEADMELFNTAHDMHLTNWTDEAYVGSKNLLYAAAFGRMSLCKQILESGYANINVSAGYWGTALQAACSFRGDIEVVQLLINHGADVNVSGGFYGNPLQTACFEGGDIHKVKLLLEKGAKVNVGDKGFHGTALSAAADVNEGTEVLRLLLKQGANVNARGGRFGTALQMASSKGNVEAVRLLLEHGANVHIEGGYYGSAIKAAQGLKDETVLGLLRTAAARDEEAGLSRRSGSFSKHEKPQHALKRLRDSLRLSWRS